jgi:hypothetical protein
MPYENKVGDQVLLKKLGILWKLSILCTGTYPVTNMYKNGTIRIQNETFPEIVNICRIIPFIKELN